MENGTTKTAEIVVWDGVVKGLGLRTRGQRGTWIVQTRIEGRTVKRTLGDQCALSRPAARDAATQLMTDLTVSVPKQRFLDVTVAEFGAKYIEDKSADWVASTIRGHGHDLKVNITPALGDIRPPGSNSCKGMRRRKTSFKAMYLTQAE